MLLKDYVKQTLLDITQGVADARSEACLCIAPGYFHDVAQTDPSMVTFEVAISVSKDDKGKIEIVSFAVAEGNYSTESYNKVSFSVPVFFSSDRPYNAPKDSPSK